jgi:glycosyltransferase involved in cell wall biosynthesis
MLQNFWFHFHFHGIFFVFIGRQICKIYVWRARCILSSKRNCVQFAWIVTKWYIAEIIEKFYQSHFNFLLSFKKIISLSFTQGDLLLSFHSYCTLYAIESLFLCRFKRWRHLKTVVEWGETYKVSGCIYKRCVRKETNCMED